MAMYTNRVNSFADYVQNPYNARGSELALAGFHFIGRPDKVRCFACGLPLSHWQISTIERAHQIHAGWLSLPETLIIQITDQIWTSRRKDVS